MRLPSIKIGVEANAGRDGDGAEANVGVRVRRDVDDVRVPRVGGELVARRLAEDGDVALARRQRQRTDAVDVGVAAERVERRW